MNTKVVNWNFQACLLYSDNDAESTKNRFEVLAEITKFKLNADIVSFFLHCNCDHIAIYFEYTTKTVPIGVCTQK